MCSIVCLKGPERGGGGGEGGGPAGVVVGLVALECIEGRRERATAGCRIAVWSGFEVVTVSIFRSRLPRAGE